VTGKSTISLMGLAAPGLKCRAMIKRARVGVASGRSGPLNKVTVQYIVFPCNEPPGLGREVEQDYILDYDASDTRDVNARRGYSLKMMLLASKAPHDEKGFDPDDIGKSSELVDVWITKWDGWSSLTHYPVLHKRDMRLLEGPPAEKPAPVQIDPQRLAELERAAWEREEIRVREERVQAQRAESEARRHADSEMANEIVKLPGPRSLVLAAQPDQAAALSQFLPVSKVLKTSAKTAFVRLVYPGIGMGVWVERPVETGMTLYVVRRPPVHTFIRWLRDIDNVPERKRYGCMAVHSIGDVVVDEPETMFPRDIEVAPPGYTPVGKMENWRKNLHYGRRQDTMSKYVANVARGRELEENRQRQDRRSLRTASFFADGLARQKKRRSAVKIAEEITRRAGRAVP
jgi:hypothetical protein